jgi:hypothetical protein
MHFIVSLCSLFSELAVAAAEDANSVEELTSSVEARSNWEAVRASLVAAARSYEAEEHSYWVEERAYWVVEHSCLVAAILALQLAAAFQDILAEAAVVESVDWAVSVAKEADRD